MRFNSQGVCGRTKAPTPRAVTNPDLRLVLTTCPDDASAEAIAKRLVEERCVACVTILPKGKSVYWWKDQVEQASEHVLLIKGAARDLSRIEQCLRALHPYELPELIAVPIVGGLADYLAWVDDPKAAK